MAASTDRLLYLPLEPSQIRLLTLYQGSDQDPLYCSLTHANLYIENTVDMLRKLREGMRGIITNDGHPAPIYEALSYMWGPDETYASIQIDNYEFAVRRNLWHALHHLRRSDRPRTLWIDAICIDQNNIPERGMQVSIMASIYWRASQVLVWLGEAAEGSDEAMHAISSGDHAPLKDNYDAWKILIKQNSKEISSLAMRPYWRRLWIIQEVFMAASLRVYCGSKSISWNDFVKVCKLLGLSTGEPWGSISKTYAGNVIDLRSPHLRSFEILLDLAHVFQCSDSKDKIYGLLGLAADPGLRSLNPDYAKTPAQLYMEVMELVTSPGYILPIPFALDVMGCSWRLQRVLEQPFWDPVSKDYTQIGYLEGRNTCEVTLHKFDKISLVGQKKLLLDGKKKHVAGSKFDEAMREVITWSRLSTDMPNQEDILQEKLREFVNNPQNVQRIVDVTKVPHSSKEFRFFMTVGGNIGIAPYNSRPGDTACVISNGVDCTDLIIFQKNQENVTEHFILGRASIPVYEGRLLGSGMPPSR